MSIPSFNDLCAAISALEGPQRADKPNYIHCGIITVPSKMWHLEIGDVSLLPHLSHPNGIT